MDRGGNVVLIGFMGAGKTSIGKIVAGQLGVAFVDLDERVENLAGRKISEIFERDGESPFRRLETQALASLNDGTPRVISTGGGVVTTAENHALLKALGYVIWLDASEDIMWERLKRQSHRPLLQTADPRATLRDLTAKRRPLYEALADILVDSTSLTLDQCAYGVAESARVYFASRRGGE